MRSILLATALLFSALTFAQGGAYSISETPIGTLLDDPASAAVLEEHMPGIASNPQIGAVRGFTLVAVQGLDPAMLTDETLVEIQADLSDLPAN